MTENLPSRQVRTNALSRNTIPADLVFNWIITLAIQIILVCCIHRFTSLCKNLFNLLEFLAEAFRCHLHHFHAFQFWIWILHRKTSAKNSSRLNKFLHSEVNLLLQHMYAYIHVCVCVCVFVSNFPNVSTALLRIEASVLSIFCFCTTSVDHIAGCSLLSIAEAGRGRGILTTARLVDDVTVLTKDLEWLINLMGRRRSLETKINSILILSEIFQSVLETW